MAITPFATAVNPADNTNLNDSVERSITPPASMLAGDLCILYVARKSTTAIAMSQLGGQTWTAGTFRQGGSYGVMEFWCTFNGTWTANPSIVTVANSTVVITLFMDVYRPTTGTNTSAVDVAETAHFYSAPVTPFDVSVTGQTSIAASTVTVVRWMSIATNTWGLQTGGWTNSGGAQYRNTDPGNRPISISSAYKIQTSPGATGSPVDRQLTNGGVAGVTIITTFKEQSAGVTVSNVTAADLAEAIFHNGETAAVVTGTSFGASQGAGSVIISPTNNIADAGAVTQAISSWGNTSITLGALSLSTFTPFTNLFLFVKNNSAQSNSSGFIVQREMWATVTAVLKNLAGATQNNLTNVVYSMRAVSPRGTELIGNTNGTTDGSGNITIGPYVLTSGGPLNNGDDVWVTAAFNGASQALSPATQVKVTPTYT